MATEWVSAQQLQGNIDLIQDLLQKNGPDYEDRAFYEQMLEEQYEELANVQRNQAAPAPRVPTNFGAPQLVQPVSPASSSGASRKRGIGYNAAYPDSKRPSVNPSPLTPNTPNSVISEPMDHRQTYAGPSRQQSSLAHGYQGPGRQQTMPFALSRPAQSNIIDLTESDPPTPDPFPELNNAFLSGAPQPADACDQDFMPEEELAQFLLTPNPAGASHASHQPLPNQQMFIQPSLPSQHPVAGPSGAYEVPDVPLYIGNADKPWAPSDNDDEYGEPLTYSEVQAVENLLGNVSAHDAEDAPERREQTPRTMSSQLKEYQKIGLTWLIKVL